MKTDKDNSSPAKAVEDTTHGQYPECISIANGKLMLVDQPQGFPSYGNVREATNLEVNFSVAQGKISGKKFLNKKMQISIPNGRNRRRVPIYGAQPFINVRVKNASGGFDQLSNQDVTALFEKILPNGGFISIVQPITEYVQNTISGVTHTATVSFGSSEAELDDLTA